MGLAASQARFLNLVARKTNIEYEGQQINQQRTTLANQSANYYNSMLTLSVPTPPSTESYKTTVYSVNYDGKKYTFNQIAGSNSSATISWSYADTIEKIEEYGSALVKKTDDGYTAGGKTITKGANNDNIVTTAVIDELKKAAGLDSLSATDVYYSQSGSGVGVSYTYYINKNSFPTSTSAEAVSIKAYKSVESDKVVRGAWTGVELHRDSYNRIASISGTNFDNLAVTTTQITDDEAYNDAYNEYTYKTYLYQQQMENINAQTSVIQAQDKKLELRLKQLDTEQSAISQEMDSVTAVIDKNMEDSFKAFA